MKRVFIIMIALLCSLSGWSQIIIQPGSSSTITRLKPTESKKENNSIFRKGWEFSTELGYGNMVYTESLLDTSFAGFGVTFLANYRVSSLVAFGGGIGILGKEKTRQTAYFVDMLVNFSKAKTSMFWALEVGYATGTAYPEFEYQTVEDIRGNPVWSGNVPTGKNTGGLYSGTALGFIHSFNENIALKVQCKYTVGLSFGVETIIPLTVGLYAGVIYHL